MHGPAGTGLAGGVERHDCHVEALDAACSLGKCASGLDRPTDAGVDRLDRVRRETMRRIPVSKRGETGVNSSLRSPRAARSPGTSFPRCRRTRRTDRAEVRHRRGQGVDQRVRESRNSTWRAAQNKHALQPPDPGRPADDRPAQRRPPPSPPRHAVLPGYVHPYAPEPARSGADGRGPHLPRNRNSLPSGTFPSLSGVHDAELTGERRQECHACQGRILQTRSIRRRLRRCAREVFGWERLRPSQLDAMTAVMEGRDTIVVMPTGAGKSAVYQVPGCC